MLDQTLATRAEDDYRARRVPLALRFDARLHRAATPAQAARAAAKTITARYEEARKAIGHTVESLPNLVATAGDLTALFDRIVANEPGSCINAVATVAGRWADPATTMAKAQAAVARAHERGRKDALRHLADDAAELAHRGDPLLMRWARKGFSALIGGGLLWRGWLWVSQHWPQISAHLHH